MRSNDFAVSTEAFFTNRNGLKLFRRVWTPVGDTKAVVVLIHGIFEHGGRYESLAQFLVQNGYRVYALDLRGHGRSEGPPALILRFDDYLDDLEDFLVEVRRENPNTKLFLHGHSMGGAIVTWLAISRPLQTDGIILNAAALLVGGRVFPFLRHLAVGISYLFPRLRMFRFGCYFMSRDPAVREEFKNDPLCYHGSFPLRTGAEILKTIKKIRKDRKKFTFPVLLLHGTKDVITDPRGSREFFEGISSHDKKLKLYEGLYHQIHLEPEREEVMRDIVGWLNERTDQDHPSDNR